MRNLMRNHRLRATEGSPRQTAGPDLRLGASPVQRAARSFSRRPGPVRGARYARRLLQDDSRRGSSVVVIHSRIVPIETREARGRLASRLVAFVRGGGGYRAAFLRHPASPGTGSAAGAIMIAAITLRSTVVYLGASIARSPFVLRVPSPTRHRTRRPAAEFQPLTRARPAASEASAPPPGSPRRSGRRAGGATPPGGHTPPARRRGSRRDTAWPRAACAARPGWR